MAREILRLALAILVTLSLFSGKEISATEQARRPVPLQAQERLERVVGHELRMLPFYSVFDNIRSPDTM
jgi:hypothetical protein